MLTSDVRVLLFDLPPLVRDMLATSLGGEPGVQLIDAIPEPGRLDEFARANAVDAIVCGTDPDGLPPECRELLERGERLRILALRLDDGTGTLHRLLPDRAELGALASAGVVEALRVRPGEGAA